ncbi:MAG TPA: GspE/PulE family protein [Synergistaceae bacterium]|nr:GspE/PulE family protein [Synergistaceae bacterium]
MGEEKLRLGDILIKAMAITPDQLQEALEEQKRSRERLGELLISKGWVSERQVIEALGNQLKKQIVSLSRFTPMPEALQLVPEYLARRLKVVPMSVTGNGTLMVGISDPLDVFSLDELCLHTNREVDVNLATLTDINRALDHIYEVKEEATEEIEVLNTAEERLRDSGTSVAYLDEAFAVDLVNRLINEAVREGTSDIHVEPHEKTMRIRFRVDGALFDAHEYPRDRHPAVASRIKIMAGMDIADKRRPQDGRIILKVQNRKVDFRVSSLPTVYGEKIVIRILDQENSAVGLEKVGFFPEDKRAIEDILTVPYGIILITGPTGSGKSTTLYSMLERINQPESNVITVEDPVEYSIHGINQVHVNEKAGLTFASALRSILRQDPDKVMIGEIRDLETAQMAVRAALTGHTVFSTLHTNDAPSTVVRLTDMGIPPFLVASSLMASIAQRLVRRVCPHCREEMVVPDNLADPEMLPKGSRIYKARGCDACRGTGYSGRTALFEIMLVDENIRRLIVANATARDIYDQARAEGMKTLREQGLRKVYEGETTLEEVLHVTMA